MIDRLAWRVQPIEHIRKRKQRHKEMQQREKQFAEYVERVLRERKDGTSNDKK